MTSPTPSSESERCARCGETESQINHMPPPSYMSVPSCVWFHSFVPPAPSESEACDCTGCDGRFPPCCEAHTCSTCSEYGSHVKDRIRALEEERETYKQSLLEVIKERDGLRALLKEALEPVSILAEDNSYTAHRPSKKTLDDRIRAALDGEGKP